VRFVLAIVCFVIAALAMGLGIAERTVLAGPDQVSATTTTNDGAPVTVIDGSALNAYPQSQTVQLQGGSSAFAAYGRTSDVLAWVGNANYTLVTFNVKTGKLVSQLHKGTENTVPDPSGSDLWIGQYAGAEANSFHLRVPSTISVLAVSDGTSPAPSTVKLSWPVDNNVPWSGPVIGGGAVMLVIGLVLLLWAFTHLRKTRGPRRSQPRMPKLPRQQRYKPSRRAVTTTKGRRSINRFVALVPVVGVTALVLAGCTAVPAPSIPTPTQTAKSQLTTTAQIPSVTKPQLEQIMQRISSTVATADDTSSAQLVTTRMAGPALEERLANYKIRKTDKKEPAATPIPATTLAIALPQASNIWPRTVFAVVQDKSSPTAASVALMLVQDDPRSNYKVNYSITLQPKTPIPELAPTSIGAAGIDPQGKLLKLPAGSIAMDYGDILLHDTSSASYSLFQAVGDTLRTQVGMAAKLKEQKGLPSTAKLTFANVQGDGRTIALATLNSGAIVAVNLNEVETVRPVKAGAAVSAKGGGIKALSGKATSTKGLVATYGDQLLFYVPPVGASGKIVLLGYSEGLIAAQEYKK
jgi:hypothetical protein